MHIFNKNTPEAILIDNKEESRLRGCVLCMSLISLYKNKLSVARQYALSELYVI